MLKNKRKGTALSFTEFTGRGREGAHYLVFRTRNGSFHVFAEVDAKEAARDCGAGDLQNTRMMWESLWEEQGGAEHLPKDPFGCRPGTNRAKANTVLTTEPKTMKQIMEEAGINDTVYTHMNNLIKKGLVVKVGDGYALKSAVSGTPGNQLGV